MRVLGRIVKFPAGVKIQWVFGIMLLIWHNCQRKELWLWQWYDIKHTFNDTFVSMILADGLILRVFTQTPKKIESEYFLNWALHAV